MNYNDLSAVKEALDQGANPSFIHPKFGWTSIHHAAKLGYTEIIKALLSKSGSNPNVKTPEIDIHSLKLKLIMRGVQCS